MAKEAKTNVMRVLDSKKIYYKHYAYDHSLVNGAQVANALGQDAASVFKTLVTVGKTGVHYVFMVPVEEELDLKKAAKAVGEKSVEMILQKTLLPLTGYVHGGCSPIGMKKQFPTTIHETARQLDTIFFSAGKVGHQVAVCPEDLLRIVPLQFADIIKE